MGLVWVCFDFYGRWGWGVGELGVERGGMQGLNFSGRGAEGMVEEGESNSTAKSDKSKNKKGMAMKMVWKVWLL